ncbi:hypothetical protein SteCoe_12044 [Stentor coeruleus]|uniref:Uncharacterized protein n=1 Tax=Stentor coeruleus TaxID=5963 RepID=A0A1R2CBT6_9CILI|nr:hypothetical protein SteCoe_12044 [Stentor coeruleus]
MNSDFDIMLKILIIGDGNTGKTSLLLKYTENTIRNTPPLSTIGVDFKFSTILLDYQIITLQLWDTAGQDRFRNLAKSYYRGAKGIFIVFDVANRLSFINVTKWYEESLRYLPENTIRFLIGNKCDIKPPDRIVLYEEASCLASTFGMEYIETSAISGENVESIFLKIAAAIIAKPVKVARTISLQKKSMKDKKPSGCKRC